MGWLFAAFAAVWIAFFLYVARLGGKLRAMSEEVEALSKRVH